MEFTWTATREERKMNLKTEVYVSAGYRDQPKDKEEDVTPLSDPVGEIEQKTQIRLNGVERSIQINTH